MDNKQDNRSQKLRWLQSQNEGSYGLKALTKDKEGSSFHFMTITKWLYTVMKLSGTCILLRLESAVLSSDPNTFPKVAV